MTFNDPTIGLLTFYAAGGFLLILLVLVYLFSELKKGK